MNMTEKWSFSLCAEKLSGAALLKEFAGDRASFLSTPTLKYHYESFPAIPTILSSQESLYYKAMALAVPLSKHIQRKTCSNLLEV